jgi:predicted MFS family arabinose efflux permease
LATALLLLVAGRTPLVLALSVAVIVGCTEPIVVALTSLLPRFVPAERLPRAYGLEASSYSVAAIAGPGLAAAIAAYAGGSRSGIVIVAAAAAGAVALAFLPLPGPGEPVERRGTVRDVVIGGLHVLAANRKLRALTVATTFSWLGFGGVAVTAVLFAQHIGADASAGGRLLVAFAVGSLIGSLVSARWLKARIAERVVLGGLVAFGAALALVCLAPSLPWALVCFLLAGLVEGPVFTATLMLRQRESPPDRLGQVNTTGGSLKIGGSAIGAALTGVFADEIGPVGLLLAIAACQLIGALSGLLILLWPSRETSGECGV